MKSSERKLQRYLERAHDAGTRDALLTLRGVIDSLLNELAERDAERPGGAA